MAGKIKRFLKEKCPECGSILLIREIDIPALRRGNQILISEEHTECSNPGCAYYKEMEQKRRRRLELEI